MISYKLMVSYYLRGPVGLYFMHLYVEYYSQDTVKER